MASVSARMVSALTMLRSIEKAVTFPECVQPCGQVLSRGARSSEGVLRRFRGDDGTSCGGERFCEGELQMFRGDDGTS